ncbi:PREDICTED: uncharacterized protein LOC107170486 [Diuraphis noxia]|uniref:uncharacterized protein LOC107170486 n=1 Tax=Diuraphis noxia TaxID=143948 RepID=UPI00076391A2|nr:PREDICTED: uncharacterized protein LOC107170486 [Diuraphis noxia]
MKSYSVIAVTIVLALFAANASAHSSFDGQDNCDIKYHLHENLASVLSNPVGVRILNNLRQSTHDICMDPKAHNGLVSLYDGIINLTTDTNISLTLGNIFFWVRKIMKNPNFRIIWHNNMKGLNMVFDNLDVVRQITKTIFDNLELILRSPHFDSTFDMKVQNLSNLQKLSNNVVVKAANTILYKKRPVQTRRLKSRNDWN